MKWFWRYKPEDWPLWKEVIHHKYGQVEQWCTDEVTDTCVVEWGYGGPLEPSVWP